MTIQAEDFVPEPVSIAEVALITGAPMEKAGADDEPRDDHGRWTDGGGADSERAAHEAWVEGLISGQHREDPKVREWARQAAQRLGRPRGPATPAPGTRNAAGVDASNRTTTGHPLPWTKSFSEEKRTMDTDQAIIQKLKTSGLYDQLAAQVSAAPGGITVNINAAPVEKQQPDVGAVHAGGTIGGRPKRKAPPVDDDEARDITEESKRAADTEFSLDFRVSKSVPDQRLIFGWASVAQVGDQEVIDKQGDIIPIDELEKAAYSFALNFRQLGDMHERIGTGRLVESMAFTPEKEKLGLVAKTADGKSIYGLWAGFKVDDDEMWERAKGGKLPEFSISGRARGEPA